MTKREICERLMEVRDYVKETDTWGYKNDERNLALHNASVVIANDLRDIILDLVAPVEEEPKAEEKKHEPPIIHPVNPLKNEDDFYRQYPGGPIQPTC